MDHADVRERLEEALLDRAGMTGLIEAAGPEAEQLRQHLATCDPCRREFAALAATGALLAHAAPDDLRLPAEMRERVLRTVRETGVHRGPRPDSSVGQALAASEARSGAGAGAQRVAPVAAPTARRLVGPPPFFGWRLGAALATVAAVVVLAAGALLGRSLVEQRDAAKDQVVALSQVTAMADRLLAVPGHVQATLRGPAGQPAGTVLFDPSSAQLLVFSTALRPDAPNDSYDCYMERDGQKVRIGWMEMAGGTAYWVGTLPAGMVPQAGDRFLVLTDRPGATPALSGTF